MRLALVQLSCAAVLTPAPFFSCAADAQRSRRRAAGMKRCMNAAGRGHWHRLSLDLVHRKQRAVSPAAADTPLGFWRRKTKATQPARHRATSAEQRTCTVGSAGRPAKLQALSPSAPWRLQALVQKPQQAWRACEAFGRTAEMLQAMFSPAAARRQAPWRTSGGGAPKPRRARQTRTARH